MFTKSPGGKAGRRENPRNCHHLISFTRLPTSMFILFSLLLIFSRLSTATTESNVIFSRFSTVTTESNVKAMFIFGDSIVDSGNNDFLDTNAKSNYFPYGVDFPLGATGRFTNGRTSADILGQLLGLPHLLPVFHDPQTRGSSILAGVNYASAGAGILDSTRQSQNVTSLSHQIANFGETTLPDLKSQLNGSLALSSYLSQSIFFFFIGGGDYMASCTASSGVAVECDLQSLTELLIGNYTNHLTRAYDFGARKFVVFNLMRSGCDPYFKLENNGSCVDSLNEGSTLFNNALSPALENLSEDLPGFSFVYINTSGIMDEIMDDPTTYGLKVTNGSCCFTDPAGIRPLCVEGTEPCPDRSIYAYYEGLHLTEKLYMHLSTRAYSSELQTEAYPFNVEVLANLNISLMLTGAPSFHTRGH